MNVPVLRSNKILFGFIGAAIIIVILFSAFAVYFNSQLASAQPNVTAEELIDIGIGSSPAAIASQLKQHGLIKNQQAFLLYARLTGKIGKFKAGQYLLNPSLDTPAIISLLEKGKVATLSFTIPEGYELTQIAGVLADKGITTDEEFWAVVTNNTFPYSFLKDLPNTKTRLEGYLFPDTYQIPRGMKIDKVIDLMLKRFENVYSKLPENKTGLTVHEVVTLASIIEKESVLDTERPLIASVFLNRLKIGMKLDSDATIQYLLGEHTDRVLYKDLEIDSPYNTYRNKGLPPGPIGSPGEASLAAVVKAEDTKYMYFVARKDGSGEHVFSVTFQEHITNKNKLGY